MTRIFPYLLLVSAIGLTAAGGVLHGRYSHRWGATNEIKGAAQALANFPAKVGNWQTHDSYELPKEVLDTLQCSGQLYRRYVNDVTGETVTVAILLGPAGPISVHTPEVCYSSRDYALQGERKPIHVKDKSGTTTDFWSTTFRTNDVQQSLLRVMFAWTTDGRWQAAENPRFAFAGQPFLYKIQLASILPPNSENTANDACESFLQEFVPVLNRQLFVGNRK